ncbi:TetR family transcriptional regulator [Nocardioides sp. HDW12B]|uniref:TetR/AcrR family transcriptional regulator n=1 Tax=Nocardioides sp. HDW12B TaxID=2714939 RepID=UPI00140C69FC|nr:TetR/AcrR family transcriptional regulator [Nocardioides sp. HDW12B]QIK67837.1 TetR family transcriptional regulator [Nocardioides sp. HDW12B]
MQATTSGRRYHHGDLRRALVDAALARTRHAGPDGLALRVVTRDAGVSPNAAYRHFADRDALLGAVADEVMLRMATQMRAHARSEIADPGERARDLLRAVGLGYVEFARSEPGWFAVAFFAAREHQQPGPEGVAAREPAPYLLLVEALDGLVAAGLVEPAAHTAALWACWSTVHGFAELAIHGPLRTVPDPAVRALAAAAVDAVIAGVTGGADGTAAAHER